VGIGLCHLFAASGCEGEDFARPAMDALANDMGLFLQKTNIIRDYLEDILEEPAPRMFWPREVWGKYAQQLAAFKVPENRRGGMVGVRPGAGCCPQAHSCYEARRGFSRWPCAHLALTSLDSRRACTVTSATPRNPLPSSPSRLLPTLPNPTAGPTRCAA